VEDSPARHTETLAIIREEYGDTIPRTGMLKRLKQADEIYNAYLKHLYRRLEEARIQRVKVARLLRESGRLAELEDNLEVCWSSSTTRSAAKRRG
jgi:hypothetical protein